ncbi:MAG: T9SS type A sorting domain-containing protein [Bacteroidetes bacterium]|nr:T9SS type A sorting domain-containing protein [Bacteroidota bacterium]
MRITFLTALLLSIFTSVLGQTPILINDKQAIDTCPGPDVALTVNDPDPDTYTWSYTIGAGYSPCTDGTYFSGSGSSVLTVHTSQAKYLNSLLTLQCTVAHPDGSSTNYTVPFRMGFSPFLRPAVVQKTTAVCAGTDDVVFSAAPSAYTSSYLWNYSGSGATIVRLTDTSVKISFGPTATSGTINIISQNKCGLGPVTSLPVAVNSQRTAAPAAAVVGQSVCSSQSVSAGGTTYSDPATCGIIASVTPFGTSPVAGTIQSCVTIDAAIQAYNNVYYLQRHFNLAPSLNPSTSTATTTLYFTQDDFTTYNIGRGGPAFPTGPTDSPGIQNIRVTQFDGTGTSPGTYSSLKAVINPDDSNIVWNAAAARWEIKFSHTGFGGFFLSASLLSEAPIITAQPQDVKVCAGTTLFNYTNANASNTNSNIWQLSLDKGATWTTITNNKDFQLSGFNYLAVYGNPDLDSGLLRCIFSNAAGSDTTNTARIFIDPGVSTPGFNTPATTVCQGVSQLYSVHGAGPADSIFFSVTGPAMDHFGLFDTTALLNFNVAPGVYTLTTYLANGCGVESASIPITVNPPAGANAGTAGQPSDCVTYPAYPTAATTFSNNTCNPISVITPSGDNPVTGNIQSCVTIDATVQSYNGIPYVPRHYNLEPSTNASTSTATVTLYFTQSDFDAYNAARGASPALPQNPTDAAGIANLHVTQFHGTGTTPDTYVGGSGDIDPDDNNIVWNASASRWEVTFNITGFSGFFVSGSPIVPLPLTLTTFTGEETSTGNQLHCTTTMEENTAWFTIQKQTNSAFEDIARLPAAGNSNQPRQYSYTDAEKGDARYRLKMTDIDGRFSYSRTITLTGTPTGLSIRILPNPAAQPQSMTIGSSYTAVAVLTVTDIGGRRLQEKRLTLQKGNNSIDPATLTSLPQGIYLVKIATGQQQQTIKFIKE